MADDNQGRRGAKEPSASPEILNLAFDLGLKRLDAQAIRLESLRTRTVTLTALILSASGLLMKEVITAGAKHGWQRQELLPTGIAGALTLVGLLAGVRLAWPTDEWKLTFSGQTIVDGYVDHPVQATIEETHRGLVRHCEDNADENEGRLRHLNVLVSIQLASFALALGGWTWALVATR